MARLQLAHPGDRRARFRRNHSGPGRGRENQRKTHADTLPDDQRQGSLLYGRQVGVAREGAESRGRGKGDSGNPVSELLLWEQKRRASPSARPWCGWGVRIPTSWFWTPILANPP